MNALTETQPQSPSNAYSAAMSALMLELAKCLKLVAPISMNAEAQMVWLQAAVDALEGIHAQEVGAISAELRRTVTRPSQIVPAIAELVAQRRKARQPHRPPSPHAIELQLSNEYNARLAKAGTPQERENAWADHRNARIKAGLHVAQIPKPLSQRELDGLSPTLRKMGISAGFLEYRDGQLREIIR